MIRLPPSRLLSSKKVGRRGLGARLVRSPYPTRNWGKMKLTEWPPFRADSSPLEWQELLNSTRLGWPIVDGLGQRTRTGFQPIAIHG